MNASNHILNPGDVVEVSSCSALGVFIRYTGSKHARSLVLLHDGHTKIVNTDNLKLASDNIEIHLAGKSWKNGKQSC